MMRGVWEARARRFLLSPPRFPVQGSIVLYLCVLCLCASLGMSVCVCVCMCCGRASDYTYMCALPEYMYVYGLWGVLEARVRRFLLSPGVSPAG